MILEIKGLSSGLFLPDEDSGEDDVVKSLERMGSVAYAGSIRPDKIVAYSIEDSDDWSKRAIANPDRRRASRRKPKHRR